VVELISIPSISWDLDLKIPFNKANYCTASLRPFSYYRQTLDRMTLIPPHVEEKFTTEDRS